MTENIYITELEDLAGCTFERIVTYDGRLYATFRDDRRAVFIIDPGWEPGDSEIKLYDASGLDDYEEVIAGWISQDEYESRCRLKEGRTADMRRAAERAQYERLKRQFEGG